MEITLQTFLIVVPMTFLAGFVDAIGGGGGLISIPGFLFAGLPPHAAVATNKLSSSGGMTLATIHFFRNGYINMKLAVPTVVAAIIGSIGGARLSMLISEQVLTWVLIAMLPISAFFVLNKKLFNDNGKDTVEPDAKTYVLATVTALLVGGYDGFYGPGSGTFLIVAFTAFAGMSIRSANGQGKVINLTTCLSSMVVYLLHGQVIIPVGIASCAANMLGGWLGARLAVKNGAKIVKPIVLLVLVMLFLKVLLG